jgi:hypothetical protein
MNFEKRARIILPSVLCLLAAPMMRADLFTSLSLSGQVQIGGLGPPVPVVNLPSVACGATGTNIASCSETGSGTIDGSPVPTTVSGTAEAEFGSLSIVSLVITNTDFFINNILLENQNAASFSNGVIVQALGYTNGFLQFSASDFCQSAALFCPTVTAVIDGQSYNVTLEQGNIDIPVEFGVPFLLDASLEMQGDNIFESVSEISNHAELDLQPVVLDPSGNPIPGATITQTPEVSSWGLLLTASLFIVPAIRQRFKARL